MANWTNIRKNPIINILKEDGFFLLQETNDKIITEAAGSVTYTNTSKNSSSWVNDLTQAYSSLLQENGDSILRENANGHLLIETLDQTAWTNITKS